MTFRERFFGLSLWKQILFKIVISLVFCISFSLICYFGKIPNPNIILMTVMVIVGTLLGYVGAIIGYLTMVIYSRYIFSGTNGVHDWVTFTPENRNKFLVILIGGLICAVFVSILNLYTIRLYKKIHFENINLTSENKALGVAATIDPLTELYNRRQLNADLSKIKNDKDKPCSILMFDVDHFKEYNDIYGHVQGDETLKRVASLLKQEASDYLGTAYRYGGEEFIIILNLDTEGSKRVAQTISDKIHLLQIEHRGNDNRGYASISCGIYTLSEEDRNLPESTILDYVDEGLYAAKHNGRDRIEIYSK